MDMPTFEKPQQESIKLTKNAKREYQWEIKINEEAEITKKTVERLGEINIELERRYGIKI